jgi:hypothetical protein
MDPYDRYQIVKDTIHSLESDTRSKTYGWYALHNSYLNSYYEAFEDFEKIHPDLDSNEFRENCREMNILLSRLLKDYKIHQWFGLYDYLRFNQILLKNIEYVFQSESTDLSDMMTSLLNLSGETNEGSADTKSSTCAGR